MSEKVDRIYDQISATFEAHASMLEAADAAMFSLVKDLDWSKLDGDKRTAIQNWHKGIQQATTIIRCPE